MQKHKIVEPFYDSYVRYFRYHRFNLDRLRLREINL